MKNNVLEINKVGLTIKTYNGQNVVTFKDVDRVHAKESGVTKRNFTNNKKYLVENEDYFEISNRDVGVKFTSTYGFSNKAPKGILLTEMGYLMIAKSFSDKESWGIQRKLVKSYFKLKEVGEVISNEDLSLMGINSINLIVDSIQNNFGIVCHQINSMENVLDFQYETFNKVMENMTLSTRQQEKILQAARKRVNHLLGGAHSAEYKKLGRTYLANLWNNFKSELKCGSSYKDLNPSEFQNAIEFINNWTYIER